jgi:hypothetical protein
VVLGRPDDGIVAKMPPPKATGLLTPDVDAVVTVGLLNNPSLPDL